MIYYVTGVMQHVMHKESLCTFLFISVLLLITLAALFHYYYLGASEMKLISSCFLCDSPLILHHEVCVHSCCLELEPVDETAGGVLLSYALYLFLTRTPNIKYELQ